MNTTTPTFRCSSVAGATCDLLKVVDSTTKAIPVNAVKEVGTSYVPPSPLPNGDAFQWFVQAFHDSGDAGIVSKTIIFNTTSLVGTPHLNSYAGAATGVTPTLGWNAVSGAVKYTLHLVHTTRGTVEIYNQAVASTSFSAVNSRGVSANFGGTRDVPLVADIDGDGKADFGIYGLAPGFGYRFDFLTSSSGFNPVNQVMFNNNRHGYGNARSIPIVADFDGSGKAGYGLFNPSASPLRSTSPWPRRPTSSPGRSGGTEPDSGPLGMEY